LRAAGFPRNAADVAGRGTGSGAALNLAFFRNLSFSAAVGSLGLTMFGLVGSLFLLTQFLQFNLGYSALQAGVRMLPIAAAMAVIAPASSIVVRMAGTKLTTAAGLLLIAIGLWQVSHASVTWTYTDMLPGLILTGIGAALVMPAVSGSVMGSLPRSDLAVGSATNGVFIQVGGALGVAVIGSLLSTRYQDRMTAALAPYHLPHAIENTILGSISGAIGVAARAGGAAGHVLAQVARSAFHQRGRSRAPRRGSGRPGRLRPGAGLPAGPPICQRRTGHRCTCNPAAGTRQPWDGYTGLTKQPAGSGWRSRTRNPPGPPAPRRSAARLTSGRPRDILNLFVLE